MSPRFLIDQFKEYIRTGQYTREELLDRLNTFYSLGVINEQEKQEIEDLINAAF